jgi:hypothetical protein
MFRSVAQRRSMYALAFFVPWILLLSQQQFPQLRLVGEVGQGEHDVAALKRGIARAREANFKSAGLRG